MNVIEGDANDDPEINQLYEDNIVEDVYGDEGETITCIVERLLMAPPQSSTSQQDAIFRLSAQLQEKCVT